MYRAYARILDREYQCIVYIGLATTFDELCSSADWRRVNRQARRMAKAFTSHDCVLDGIEWRVE